jgi:lipopolysaccharide/colanic/teichoic acid biosynthesis glycosyltransferase
MIALESLLIEPGMSGTLQENEAPTAPPGRIGSACNLIGDLGSRLLACLLLALFLPFIVVGGLLVKLTSRGPVFYTQTRVGRNGVLYTIYKLRSMRHNCEKQSGACWSTTGDPRITRIGRLLRASHIDELPQLWNVICGHMSLIGPRPERPEFVRQLNKVVPRYSERLSVRPGLTGLAQVVLPPDSDIASVRRKLAHDLYYIAHRGWWLDVRLLIGTALILLRVPDRLSQALLRLPAAKDVERQYEDSVRPVVAAPHVHPVQTSASAVYNPITPVKPLPSPVLKSM